MADYARRDYLRDQRRRAESNRRLRSRRRLRGGAPALAFAYEGRITLERAFLPQLVTIDPNGDGDYPEYKRIIGVDAELLEGSVEISWLSDSAGYFYENHVITPAVSNRQMLAEPFVIDSALEFGERIRIVLLEEPVTPSFHLVCWPLFETVPV